MNRPGADGSEQVLHAIKTVSRGEAIVLGPVVSLIAIDKPMSSPSPPHCGKQVSKCLSEGLKPAGASHTSNVQRGP